MPEVLREAPMLAKASTPEEALQQLQNAAQHMGNSIRIPGEDAGEEDWSKFNSRLLEKVPGLMPKPDVESDENLQTVYKAMGQPDAPSKYQFEVPEGRNAEDVPLETIQQLAHKAGLNQKQFNTILGGLMAKEWENQDQFSQEQTEDLKALQTDWGLATQQNMQAVTNWLSLTNAPESLVNMAKDSKLSAADYKWLHSVAVANASQTALTQLPKNDQEVPLTPQEALHKIDEILGNPEHPYFKASARGHQAAVKKMIDLHRFAHPNG